MTLKSLTSNSSHLKSNVVFSHVRVLGWGQELEQFLVDWVIVLPDSLMNQFIVVNHIRLDSFSFWFHFLGNPLFFLLFFLFLITQLTVLVLIYLVLLWPNDSTVSISRYNRNKTHFFRGTFFSILVLKYFKIHNKKIYFKNWITLRCV